MGNNNESPRSHRQVTTAESIYRKLTNKITLVAQTVKNLPAMQETPGLGRSPGDRNDSSLLAWEIPWTEEPGRLHSWGHKSQTRL